MFGILLDLKIVFLALLSPCSVNATQYERCSANAVQHPLGLAGQTEAFCLQGGSVRNLPNLLNEATLFGRTACSRC